MTTRALFAVVLIPTALLMAWLAARHAMPEQRPLAAAAQRPIGDVSEFADGPLRLGGHQARYVLIEFADFECPACARAVSAVDSLRLRMGDSLSVVFRHLPLRGLHPHAFAAALAAECADRQGRFDQMYHVLYSRQAKFDLVPWRQLAGQAGVPSLADFDACMSDAALSDRMERERVAAQGLQLDGTPSFVANGTVLTGVPSVAALDSLVRSRKQR